MNEIAKTLLEGKKYNQLSGILREMNATDLAQFLAELPKDLVITAFRILPKELAAETFVCMDSDMQEHLISLFSDVELKAVFDELYMDDTVDIIEEMPSNVVTRILRNSSADDRHIINELLNFPRDSAGSIMTTEYVGLKAGWTVEKAFEHIRRTGPDKETIYNCYVTDANRKLMGLITVKQLLLADMAATIGDIMETHVIYANTHDDKESVAKLFDKYDFLALPVVDNEQRLVGIITFDDALDVIREEATEDISKMGAVTPSTESYLKTSVTRLARNRIGWLLILMVSATITSGIISQFEEAIAAIPLLVAFIPMLMDTAGNCGSQSSTTIIRALSLDEISTRDFLKVAFKELRVGLLAGVTLVAVNTVRVFIMYSGDYRLKFALVSGVAMLSAVLLAKLLGAGLPMLAKKLKFDPAVMASPIITTVVDAFAVLLYFTLVQVVFAGQL